MSKIKFTDYLKAGISNKYELIMLAAQRVQALNNGSSSYFGDSGHKNTVVALGEVEQEFVDISKIREDLINSLQTEYKDDEFKEDYNLDEDNEYQVDLIDYSISEDQEDIDRS